MPVTVARPGPHKNLDTAKAIFSVSFVDQNHGWACGDESTWMWTNNGGETWTVERMEVSQVGLSLETTLAVPDIIYYGVQFIDQHNGWIVGEYGNIRHTSDGGKTWDSQHESLLDAIVEKGGMGNRDVMNFGAFFRVRFPERQMASRRRRWGDHSHRWRRKEMAVGRS